MSADETSRALSAGAEATETRDDDRGGSLLSRRTFLGCLLGAAGVAGLAGIAAPAVRYAFPVTDAAAAPKQEVAKLSGLRPGGAVLFDYQDTPCALVLLQDGTPRAYSRVCTHLGCIVMWQPAMHDFICPCHAGVFREDGSVQSGPPPRSLDQLHLIVQGDVLSVKGLVS